MIATRNVHSRNIKVDKYLVKGDKSHLLPTDSVISFRKVCITAVYDTVLYASFPQVILELH